MARICLEKVLKEEKISKYRFAQLLKMERSNVVRYFKKDYDPKLSTIERWAKVLGRSVKDFIED